MRSLAHIVEQRRVLIDDQTRITNRLTDALKQYFPQPLQWFENKHTRLFCDFLCRWPHAQGRPARPPRNPRALLQRTSCALPRRHRAAHPRHPASHTTDHRRGGSGTQHAARARLGRATACCAGSHRDVQQAIAKQAPAHPDFTIFQSFPAAGPVFAPRLLVAFGEQRERYACAAQAQKYAGIAPVTKRSGNSTWVHWRWKCPRFVRQTFVEWSALTIPRSFWARAYYEQQRGKGNSHQAALAHWLSSGCGSCIAAGMTEPRTTKSPTSARSRNEVHPLSTTSRNRHKLRKTLDVHLRAFKWLRILYRCWHDRTPYDEAAYLSALQKRGSPLIHNLAQSSQMRKPLTSISGHEVEQRRSQSRRPMNVPSWSGCAATSPARQCRKNACRSPPMATCVMT